MARRGLALALLRGAPILDWNRDPARTGSRPPGQGEPADALEPVALFRLLARLREVQGNLSNDVSFAATLLVKAYMAKQFGVTFDATAKPQGAPGIDIDVTTAAGHRIVAEVKTTVPYQPSDFGAQQAEAFKKDLAKLAKARVSTSSCSSPTRIPTPSSGSQST